MNLYDLPHNVQTYINSFDSDFMVTKFLIYQKKFHASINSTNKVYQKKIKKFYSTNKTFQKRLKKQNLKNKTYTRLFKRYLTDKIYQKQVIKLCQEVIRFHCKHTQIMVDSDYNYPTPKYNYCCRHCLQALDRKSLWKDKNVKRKYRYLCHKSK